MPHHFPRRRPCRRRRPRPHHRRRPPLHIHPRLHRRPPHRRPQPPLPSTRAESPFVFIHRTPGYSRDSRSGTLIAIWQDGTIIRAASEDQLGQSYLRAQLTPDQLAHVRRLLADSGLLTDHSDQYVVLDASTETLAVRYGTRLKTWAHSPGFENTANRDSTDPRITQLKQAFLALPLNNPAPHPPDEFASYPHDWSR